MPIQLFFIYYLEHLAKNIVVPLYKDYQHHQRKNPFNIELHLAGELKSFSRVGFCQEIIPAPALFVAAEQEEN